MQRQSCSTSRASTPPVSDGSRARRRYPNGRFTNTFRARPRSWRSTCASSGRRPVRLSGRRRRSGHDTTCAAARPIRNRGWRRRADAGMSVSQRGGRGGRGHAGSRAHRPPAQAGLHRWPHRTGPRGRSGGPGDAGNQIALLYEGASGLSTSLNDPAPWARARATAEVLIDRATTGGRRPSFRCGCRCQNGVIDRGRRDGDEGLLGAADGIEYVATFGSPRCQCVVDGLGDLLGIGGKLLQTAQQLSRLPARCDAYSRAVLVGQLSWPCGRARRACRPTCRYGWARAR